MTISAYETLNYAHAQTKIKYSVSTKIFFTRIVIIRILCHCIKKYCMHLGRNGVRSRDDRNCSGCKMEFYTQFYTKS